MRNGDSFHYTRLVMYGYPLPMYNFGAKLRHQIADALLKLNVPGAGFLVDIGRLIFSHTKLSPAVF
jgi:hypothetical protein